MGGTCGHALSARSGKEFQGKHEKGEDNLAQVFVNRLTRYWDKDIQRQCSFTQVRCSNFPAVSLAQPLMLTTKVNFSVLHMAHSVTRIRSYQALMVNTTSPKLVSFSLQSVLVKGCPSGCSLWLHTQFFVLPSL